jgi:hypothetical protein
MIRGLKTGVKESTGISFHRRAVRESWRKTNAIIMRAPMTPITETKSRRK